jgi:hypothetical protein
MVKIAFILNIGLFLFSSVFFLWDFGQVSSIICLGGLFLNVWYLIKYYQNKINSSDSSVGKFDQNLIMEDLDREAERRREVEKLNRN